MMEFGDVLKKTELMIDFDVGRGLVVADGHLLKIICLCEKIDEDRERLGEARAEEGNW